LYFCIVILIYKFFTLAKSFTYSCFIAVLFFSLSAVAQRPQIPNMNRVGGGGGGFGRFGGSTSDGARDSIGHRDKFEDSITVSFRYLDSVRLYKLDSSVNDFYRRFPLPATHIHLGNTGTASRSLLFSPMLQAGFDAGFHAFDAYKFTMDKVRFFNTTRPFSELVYHLASRSEQVIELMHTQNISPNWNFAFQYRLINAPGFFKNQKTNHNNYLFNSLYESKNKRYQNYFVLLGNKLQSAENGGIKNDRNYLDDPNFTDRFNILTNLGGSSTFGTSFFGVNINTGNKYGEFSFLMRQQYDLGKKDSIVTDSTILPLFYPRLRFEHTFQLERNKYVFEDFVADSAYYKTIYDTTLRSPTDTFRLMDRWQIFSNDFSIYQFPDAKNQQQFIRVGLTVQNLTGNFLREKKFFYNIIGHAEYRNKTRNKKWDMVANGKLWFAGMNAGDYQAHVSLQKFTQKQGYVQIGFNNVNRTPSFIFDSRSSFYTDSTIKNFKKENITSLYASIFFPKLKLKLAGNYYLLTNYTYLTNFFKLQQEPALFNVLLISVEKAFSLTKHFIMRNDIYFQQVIGNAPVNVPALYLRSRIGYEGNLGFKNLDLATGFEIRYRSPYKADSYSPLHGKYFYQDSVTIKNKLPDIAAYLHFRIRSIRLFVRSENLNTARVLDNFGFTNNNLIAPGYAYPGLQFRLGLYWTFVN
jgi:hypothetical protein